jgi:hypothetical protein
MKTEFSTFDITKGLRIPRGRLREWMNFGFITPSVQADGQGTRAVFTRSDVHTVALFRNLIDYGLNRAAAAEFMRDFADRVKKEKSSTKYPETVYIVFRLSIEKGEEIKDVLRLGPGVWKFDVEGGIVDLKLSMQESRQHITSTDYTDGDIPEKNTNWRNVHMINYKKICEDVDKALEKL